MTDEILDWADKDRRATQQALRMVEREGRIMNAYIALMAFLLGVLVGIVGYTGYRAYVGTESAVEVIQ